MYEQIKQLAKDALKLQNKDVMDSALCEIVTLCELPESFIDSNYSSPIEIFSKTDSEVIATETYEYSTYGSDKEYDSEGEMIADIQGVESSIIKPKSPNKAKVGAK